MNSKLSRRKVLGLFAITPVTGISAQVNRESNLPVIPLNFRHFRHPSSTVKIKNVDGTPLSTDIGTIASVYINREEGIVRKYFNKGLKTCGNTYPKYSNQKSLETLFDIEVNTLKKLNGFGSPYVPKLLSVNKKEMYFDEQYLGADSHTQGYQNRKFSSNDWLKEHFFNSLNEYKKLGFFKLNLSFSNYFVNKKFETMKAIDFKWSVARNKDNLGTQLETVCNILGRDISHEDYSSLRNCFSDFNDNLFTTHFNTSGLKVIL